MKGVVWLPIDAPHAGARLYVLEDCRQARFIGDDSWAWHLVPGPVPRDGNGHCGPWQRLRAHLLAHRPPYLLVLPAAPGDPTALSFVCDRPARVADARAWLCRSLGLAPPATPALVRGRKPLAIPDR